MFRLCVEWSKFEFTITWLPLDVFDELPGSELVPVIGSTGSVTTGSMGAVAAGSITAGSTTAGSITVGSRTWVSLSILKSVGLTPQKRIDLDVCGMLLIGAVLRHHRGNRCALGTCRKAQLCKDKAKHCCASGHDIGLHIHAMTQCAAAVATFHCL